MTPEEEVRQASDKFYDALNSIFAGDTEPMENIWSHGPDVVTMHPLGDRQLGWDEVKMVWQQVARAISGGQIMVSDCTVSVMGDVAFTTCIEHGHVNVGGQALEINTRGTGIYRRENGGWKVVLHQADTDPALQEAMRRQQAA